VGSTGASSGNETGALSYAALNSSIGNGHSTAKFLSVPSRNWANSGSISERWLYLGFGCATAALLGFSWIMFSLSECIPAARGLSRVSPMCIAKEALHKSTRDHGSAPLFVKLQPRVLHPKPPNVSTTVCGVNQNAEAQPIIFRMLPRARFHSFLRICQPRRYLLRIDQKTWAVEAPSRALIVGLGHVLRRIAAA
jgi:hypothetical protein